MRFRETRRNQNRTGPRFRAQWQLAIPYGHPPPIPRTSPDRSSREACACGPARTRLIVRTGVVATATTPPLRSATGPKCTLVALNQSPLRCRGGGGWPDTSTRTHRRRARATIRSTRSRPAFCGAYCSACEPPRRLHQWRRSRESRLRADRSDPTGSSQSVSKQRPWREGSRGS